MSVEDENGGTYRAVFRILPEMTFIFILFPFATFFHLYRSSNSDTDVENNVIRFFTFFRKLIILKPVGCSASNT